MCLYIFKKQCGSVFFDFLNLEADGLRHFALVICTEDHHFVAWETETLFFGDLQHQADNFLLVLFYTSGNTKKWLDTVIARSLLTAVFGHFVANHAT